MVSDPLAVRETMKWASVGLTGALNFDEFLNYIEKYLDTVEAALTTIISVDGAVVMLCLIQKTAVFWKFPLSKTNEGVMRKKMWNRVTVRHDEIPWRSSVWTWLEMYDIWRGFKGCGRCHNFEHTSALRCGLG